MKKVLVLTIAGAFTFSLAGLTFADTITRISGNRITARDSMGREKTVEGRAKGFKVGDKVKVKNGRIWLDPQPEPPAPRKVNPAALKNPGLKNKAPASPEAPPPPPPPPDKPKMK